MSDWNATIFGGQEGNTIPRDIKIPNWGRARVQNAWLKCNLFLLVMTTPIPNQGRARVQIVRFKWNYFW